MNSHHFQRLLLVVLLLLAESSSAHALERRTGSVNGRVGDTCYPAVYAAGSPLMPAVNWSIGQFLSGGGRRRTVQICVVAMCIALFIMMRKLNG